MYEEIKEDYDFALIFFYLIIYNLLILVFLFLKMPFISLILSLYTVGYYMEREDYNSEDDEDSNPDYYDEEDVVEEYVAETFYESMSEFLNTEFLEYWHSNLKPENFLLVDTEKAYQNYVCIHTNVNSSTICKY
jgi:hypothetical protein